MFGISGGEFVILAVLGLLIFGPDKLPKAIQQMGSVLRQLRKMATSAKKDLQDGLGPEFKDFDVNDLNPKSFVRRHLLEDEDEPRGRARRRSPAGLNGRRPPFDNEAT